MHKLRKGGRDFFVKYLLLVGQVGSRSIVIEMLFLYHTCFSASNIDWKINFPLENRRKLFIFYSP